MMKKIILFLGLFTQIYSDTTEKTGFPACPSNLDDHGKPAFVTLLGDSLGDFVDFPTHGIFGWTKYLQLQNPVVKWGVQK